MPKGYHHLDRDKRCQLYALLERGESVSVIANELKVDRSTIYRELKRNNNGRRYGYEQADKKAKERRYRASCQKRKMTQEAVSVVEEKLKMQWSPEQISGWLKKEGSMVCVSHETIYKHIWFNKRIGGSLYKELRHKGKKYNKRGKKKAGRGCIPGRIDIDERPDIVEEKKRLGDWELDTIIGCRQSGAIVSMVERTSKYTKLGKTSKKTAKEVEDALVEKLEPVKDFVLTLTADNGKEFASHKEVSAHLKANFYFAKPYHSWERGLNEHTNGLVRQYFPKKKRFDEITEDELKKVEELLNNRPRKVLNFSTPAEVFDRLSRETESVALHS